MTGRSSLLAGSSIGFHSRFQLLARAKGHDSSRRDRNLLAGFRVAPWALILVTQVEVAKTGELDCLSACECRSQLLVESIDELARFAFVQTELVVQRLGHIGFGECHEV